MTLLEVTDLRASFPGSVDPVLDGVDLAVDRGELVALVGESGSGKSTLARSIVGLQRPAELTGGSIELDGRELVGAGPERLRAVRGTQVGFAFQNASAAFDPVYTVGEQLTEAIAAADADEGLLASLGIPPFRDRSAHRKRRARGADLLAEVGIDDPGDALDAYPDELSGGQRQRAQLATALAGEPELLIADEPTAGLDTTTQARVLELLEELAAGRDLGLVVITHDVASVAERCDRIVVLADGRVVERGPTAAVVSSPDHPETRSLVAAANGLALDTDAMRTAVDGGFDRSVASDAAAVVELDGVTKTYGDDRGGPFGGGDRRVTAVEDVSLSVRRGESLGIVGESGGGKSTVLKLIAGLRTLTGGTVRIDGEPVGDIDDRGQELLADVGVVFQEPHGSLDPRWTARRSISEPLRQQGWPRSRREDRVSELLELVGLPSSAADARPGALSGGQVQRIAVARALATDPRVLLLDEPVSALDATTRSRLISLFEEIRARRDHAIVFVSHDLGAVSQVADRVGVLEEGHLVECGATRDVLADPAHPHTRRLIESVPSTLGDAYELTVDDRTHP